MKVKQYSDNILKGFATSLSIVISFLASVALFNLSITVSFLVGASVVLGATWMYNMPEEQRIAWYKHQGQFEGPTALYHKDAGSGRGAPFEQGEECHQHDLKDGQMSLLGDPIEPALISPVQSHEPLLGYPNGIGPSRKESSISQSIGERLLGKITNMVNFSTWAGNRDKKRMLF